MAPIVRAPRGHSGNRANKLNGTSRETRRKGFVKATKTNLSALVRAQSFFLPVFVLFFRVAPADWECVLRGLCKKMLESVFVPVIFTSYNAVKVDLAILVLPVIRNLIEQETEIVRILY